jgi:outer membrane protein OmpA-like peptidoglycan-associated protein
MIITAEPYFAVSVPSEVVVLENALRKNTQGSTSTVDAKFELLQRGDYEKAGLQPITLSPKVPLDLYQARNALQVARSAGAAQYSADSLEKAQMALQSAEGFQSQNDPNRKLVIMSAREAVQTAEDARVIATRRAEEELAARLKREAAEREAAAQARAEREARAKLEAERAAADANAKSERDARQKKEADLAAAVAETARMRAELQAQQARQEAEKQRQAREASEAARRRAEQEKADLRAGLLKQFSLILDTRDSPRGLVVNLGDVLFDTGKFELRPPAREVLAKLSGIVLSHPGLRLDVEGHTDSIGGDDLNQQLSEKRAGAVLLFLIDQGIPGDTVNARGLGKTTPVASNDTPQGRKQNRRVEIIVSGEVIGVNISSSTTRQQ